MAKPMTITLAIDTEGGVARFSLTNFVVFRRQAAFTLPRRLCRRGIDQSRGLPSPSDLSRCHPGKAMYFTRAFELTKFAGNVV